MWPISMPRTSSSGSPSTGLGSPARTSATSRTPSARKSRPTDEADDVAARFVGAGHPARAGDHAGVDDEADPRHAVGAQGARPDVSLGEGRVAGEVVVGERLGHGGGDLGLEPFEVDVAVAGHADGQRLDGPVGVAQVDDDVLQRVRRRPRALRTPEVVAAVEVVDERGDGRRARGVVDDRRGSVVVGDVGWHGHAHRLHVGRVVARRGAHERVLADLERGQELLAGRPAHGPGHRRDDDVGQAEAVERADVGVAVALVRPLQPGIVDVEAVGVLHHELPAAQQAGAGPGLVAVLRLDLVDAQRQVLVRRVQVLHEQREHLLVGRREEEVVAPPVDQPEHVVAVVVPAARGVVRLAREQGGEVDLLEPGPVHLLADDVLDVAVDEPAERQPGEPAGGRPPDVPGAHEQTVAGNLGVGRVLAQRSQEQRRHPEHPAHATARSRRASRLPATTI